MGQVVSTVKLTIRRDCNRSQLSKSKSTAPISPMQSEEVEEPERRSIDGLSDFISVLPDECLACVFQFLSPDDRKRCSLVCRRWLTIEGQSRHRLSLNAQSDLQHLIPSIFSRFDAVTKLALKCDRRSVSIGDEALVLISERCRNLTRLKLRACRDLTDAGMSAFAKNCRGLKKLSCGSCTFGAKGMNAVLDHCPALEELSVKRLRGIIDGAAAEPIGPGVAAAALKTICLKDLYNGQCFGPLIIGAKNLKSLKLFRCSGDWDKLFPLIVDRVTGIVEIHMERIQISDIGLEAISNCSNLEILHLVKTPECTNAGVVAVAEKCKLLRKLHIDGWKANRIGDQGLIAVANSCLNLQELVLIGVNPTNISLGMLASNCQNLERLALCGSDTVGDVEISCIAAKCIALKKLCIKSCPVSDHGMEALASGCPNLIKVKVKKCRGVTPEGVEWLRASRGSLAINLDTGEQVDACSTDVGAQDNGVEFPSIVPSQIGASTIASSITGRLTSNKFLGLLSGRSIVACTLRRFANSNSPNTICPRSQLQRLKPEPVSWILESHSPESFSSFFNLVLLTRLFWLCAWDAPSEVGSFYFQHLLCSNIDALSCKQAPAVLRTFLVSVGVDVEMCLMRTLGYMLAKWIILRDVSVGLQSLIAPLPDQQLGISYATEAHGFWTLKGYAPVNGMKLMHSSEVPGIGAKGSLLRYALAHQQLEAVIQLEYSVGFYEGYIQVNARVDNLRIDVAKLGFGKKSDENDFLDERHFPSRIRVWVGPEVGSTYVSGLTLGRSTDNGEREVETQRIIKGSLGGYSKGSSPVKARARVSMKNKMKNWRWDQDADGNAAVFDAVLCDNVTGHEIGSWKSFDNGGNGANSFQNRYYGVNRPFTKSGGVVFAGDNYGEQVGWRLNREMEGSVLKWRIGGEVWLSYWPNNVRSSYVETRCVEWCDEVDLPLIPAGK